MQVLLLKAVADATRLKLLKIISKGEVCACELPKYVRPSQPAVSQHLKVLLKAGLVLMRRDGVKRIYRISPKGKVVLRDVSGWQE
jgi:ArsR family transcriptional regulator, arsenate/arsenite/antimonite-responsive transcriptional repressor